MDYMDPDAVYRPTAKLRQLSWQIKFDLFLKPNTLRGVSTVPDGPWQTAGWFCGMQWSMQAWLVTSTKAT